MVENHFCLCEYKIWRIVKEEVDAGFILARFMVYKSNLGKFSQKEEKNIAFLSNLCRISFQPPGVKMVDMVTTLVCDRMFEEKGEYLKPQKETENKDRLEDQD